MVVLVEGRQSSLSSSLFYGGPVQLFKHAFHAGRPAMSVDDPVGSPSLSLFQGLFVGVCVGVPDLACIFKLGMYKDLECPVFDDD
ncbi:hypothetical protein ACOMHN_025172 [Nucella lapillus]